MSMCDADCVDCARTEAQLPVNQAAPRPSYLPRTLVVTTDVRVSVRGTLPPDPSQFAINQEASRLIQQYIGGQGGEVLWPTIRVEVID